MTALLIERRERTLVIKLSRPSKANALTTDMLAGLAEAAATIETDRQIRAAVLTADGDKIFCAGADIGEWKRLDATDFARVWIAGGHRLFDRLARLPVPLICALNGSAFGGGLELAAVCDLRISVPSARFGLPETAIGVTPGWSGLQRLARLVPQAVLREMALAGGRISAERLAQVGFLNLIDPDPLARALDLADRVAALSPSAVEAAKTLANAAAGEGPEAALDMLAGALVAGSADRAEGVASFEEKRPAAFARSP